MRDKLAARIVELEQAEREAMAQFNFITGRLVEARELYEMAGEETPPLSLLKEVDDAPALGDQ